MDKQLRLNLIDKETLNLVLHGIASEGILQGILAERHGRPIDNEAIVDRVAEALAHVEAEMRALGLGETI